MTRHHEATKEQVQVNGCIEQFDHLKRQQSIESQSLLIEFENDQLVYVVSENEKDEADEVEYGHSARIRAYDQ